MPQYTLLIYSPAHDRPPTDDPGMASESQTVPRAAELEATPPLPAAALPTTAQPVDPHVRFVTRFQGGKLGYDASTWKLS